ncbi:MAG: NAD(P)H-hydrate dehydratase [Gemmatimonadales bacterium]|nr:MAG: NAD(P)H-hydrate dehydratase [Gemmatimonadales bacterium]
MPDPGPLPPLDPSPHYFGRDGVFVATGEEAADLDRRSMTPLPRGAGIRPGVLMESAGRTAAAVLHHLRPRGPILVLAGSGGNGGDGVVLARTLHAAGRDVTLQVVGDRPHPDPLLHGHSLRILRGPALDPVELARAAVVVDAVLGIGVRGAVRPPLAELLQGVEAFRGDGEHPFVVALDLPSGVEAKTGVVHGAALSAHLTLAFGAAKLGSFLGEGRRRTGRLVVLDIGFPPWPERGASGQLVTPGWARSRRPVRAPDAHKKSAGRLLLLAGSPGMAGAAVLAARAALLSGVGYLQVVADSRTRGILQASVPEALVVEPDRARELVGEVDAVAAGPGMGTDPEAPGPRLLTELLSGDPPRALLLDADALTLLARGHLSLPAPSGPGATRPRRRILLTPHPGEMARLEGGTSPEAEASEDPLRRARALAVRMGVCCLLKGSPTIVAGPEARRPVLVAPTSSPALARAGMGDVLTGVAAGLMAQGLLPEHAAGVALHLTGRAADLAGRGHPMGPSDVLHHLPAAWAEEGDGSTDLPGPFILYDRGPP